MTSKKAWSPGRSRRSLKTCGCGLQRSPGDGVDRLDLLRAELEQALHRHRHDLVLAHARAQHPVDVLVDRIHDRRRVLEQRDLVVGLVRARREHDRLRVDDLEAEALQREERLHVGQVDAERLVLETALGELRVDLARERVRHAGLARHRAAHRGDARAPARLGQPRRVELVVLGGRAEVPQHGVALARQQHAARALVARPLADVGARDVADVVLVEEQQRADVGGAQRRLRLLEPLASGGARSRCAAPSRPPSWRRGMRCSCASLLHGLDDRPGARQEGVLEWRAVRDRRVGRREAPGVVERAERLLGHARHHLAGPAAASAGPPRRRAGVSCARPRRSPSRCRAA